jgi:hypothetical protein
LNHLTVPVMRSLMVHISFRGDTQAGARLRQGKKQNRPGGKAWAGTRLLTETELASSY